jgi:hypothetical protein
MEKLVQRLFVHVLLFLDWRELSGLSAAEWLPLLRDNPHLVDWEAICRHYDSRLRELVANNADPVDWGRQSDWHPSTTLLGDHSDRIDWERVMKSMMVRHYGHHWLRKYARRAMAEEERKQHLFLTTNMDRVDVETLATEPNE